MTKEEIEAVFERVRAVDPGLVAGVDDVDETLLDWTAGLSVRERLDAATRATRGLARWTLEPPDPSSAG